MPYSLHDAITAVLNETDLAEPDEVAAKVAGNIPGNELRQVVGELLPARVREIIRYHRAANPIIGSCDSVLVDSPAVRETNRVRSARSSKVAAIRSAWAAELRDRVHGADGWKLLGQCNYDDLMFAAEERRQQASRNFAVAARYEELAEDLRRHNVATVADLPQYRRCAA